MNEPKRYTVTSALPYANGPAHIGHIAGAYLPADIYVRYLRSKAKDVLFVCGSDEHGAAIEMRARKEGISPKEIVGKYHGMLEKSFQTLGIDFDVYHRTSSELHHETASEYFKVLEEKGEFEVRESEQYFDEEAQQFLADRFITGECPNCHNEEAYGDQCEKCGSSLSPMELIHPKSTLSGKPPVKRKTSHWYLPMQNHESWLKSWIEKGLLNGEPHHNPGEWKTHVLGQCMSWIDGGLHPRAMTRDLDWGVKVPVAGGEGKVLYVWLDAPIGYISATKQWAKNTGKDWRPYWQDQSTKLVHFIGKDNIVFHGIIFPILLKAHGGFILPDNVPANAFLNLEEKKISTSRNWAVWIHEYAERYPDKMDELRYVLTCISPENRDSEFTWQGYADKVNNELVNNYGNFVHRALVLTHKNFESKVPRRGELEPQDKALLEAAATDPGCIGALIEKYQFREALTEAMKLCTKGNIYLTDEAPWLLLNAKKEAYNPERGATVLHVALQFSATLATVMEPFLPFSSARLFGYLNIDPVGWDHAGKDDHLPEGHAIRPSDHLFPRLDPKMVENERTHLQETLKATVSNPAAKPFRNTSTFADFQKIDMRIGQIKEAVPVPKTDKLMQLTVDTGLDVRTIISGIAQHYKAEELIGKKVSVLVNLAPKKMRGIESQGMILLAEDPAGKLVFVVPESDIDPGSEVC